MLVYNAFLLPWSRPFFPIHPSINPAISIFRLRYCPCPILWVWQHQAMSNTSSTCTLSCESIAAKPHLLPSVFTHSDCFFIGLLAFPNCNMRRTTVTTPHIMALCINIGPLQIQSLLDISLWQWSKKRYFCPHQQFIGAIYILVKLAGP